MKVLVIGGTGFIGPELVRRLSASKHDVTVFHRGSAAPGLPANVCHIFGNRNRLPDFAGEFRRFAPDVVVDVIAATARQAQALMHTFRGLAGRVVVLSSGDVYRAFGIFQRNESGPPEPVPLAEDAPLRQNLHILRDLFRSMSLDPDGWIQEDYEKILVERVVMSDSELPGTLLRLPMVYGPGDPHHRFFPYWKRMEDGRTVILLDEGTAAWRSTWGYVGDVAHAIALAVENDRARGRIYNVSEAESLTMADWVREIARARGWTGRIVIAPQPCPPPNLMAQRDTRQHLATDSSRIRRELRYRETISREEALERTLAWERDHPPAKLDPAAFDYAAEDRILDGLGRVR